MSKTPKAARINSRDRTTKTKRERSMLNTPTKITVVWMCISGICEPNFFNRSRDSTLAILQHATMPNRSFVDWVDGEMDGKTDG
mmetsp:Transcript_1324/g.3049  ORF Transcript_1324/g.3049 Transcript_1324/m.3049 type:complete len:84 (-) Transcript_1324:1644-1895(-)